MRGPLKITSEKKPAKARRARKAKATRVRKRVDRMAEFDYAKSPVLRYRLGTSAPTYSPMLEKAAVVLGGAQCVWRDLLVLETMIGRKWPGVVVAVNDVGCVWARRLDHWVTLHLEKMWRPGGWLDERRRNGHPDGYRLWSTVNRRRDPGLVGQVRQWGSGSSGLLAVTLLYELGIFRIVLCGVPMDDRPHFPESPVHDPGRRWSGVRAHRASWLKHLDRLLERTRSMNGWTRSKLGAPTLGWLCGEAA